MSSVGKEMRNNNNLNNMNMEKYECEICGYIYDPEEGDPEGDIKPGIPFSDLPDDYLCPVCAAGKEEFFVLK